MPPGNIPRSLEKYRSNPGEQDAANQVKSASKREASKIADVGKSSCRPRMKCNEMNRRMTRRSMYRIKDVLIEKCRPHRMRELSPRRSNCSMHDHRHGHLFESARETPPVYPVCRISPKADLLMREKMKHGHIRKGPNVVVKSGRCV